MSVLDFRGETFVAFTDISGFKVMMKGDGQRAINALGCLNTAGYNALRNNSDTNGFFISDCGIIFIRKQRVSKQEKLNILLQVIKNINIELIKHDIMLTTSIAYGMFSYHQRVEFEGIEKNPIFGNAYVSAFLDNENGTPRIQPGQCRIVKKGLEDELFSEMPFLKITRNHIYYYWMLNSSDEIEDFDKQYKDTYQLKYKGMLSVLNRNH